MKKLLVKSISLVLILILSALMLFSCTGKLRELGNNIASLFGMKRWESMFPAGWTGGFGYTYGLDDEHWWVETYEELMIAIEKLESHGSTFQHNLNLIINYTGDLFDVKYCIFMSSQEEGTERIEFGDDPFDRRATNVGIASYCFLEEVSIDEINYGYVRDMRCFMFRCEEGFYDFYLEKGEDFLSSIYLGEENDYPSYDSEGRRNHPLWYSYYSKEDEQLLFEVLFYETDNSYLLKEMVIKALKNSELFPVGG